MKIAGFTFIRNAVKNDYPIVEAISSILPLCDEFVVALGESEDETEALIRSIASPKIKIINTVWDDNLRNGGSVFATETNKAMAAVSPEADWLFYIQGDECVHEKYLPLIKKEMEQNLDNAEIEGLLFKYLHFYGSYDYYNESRRWYRREIRIVRNDPHIRSFKDAQGFRFDDRKLKVKLIDAFIYHYGWVKPPKGLIRKGYNFNRFYTENGASGEPPTDAFDFDYGNADRLISFTGTHPAVMQNRVDAMNWKLDVKKIDQNKRMSARRRFLQFIENYTGIRIGEYKNYVIVKRLNGKKQ